MSSEDFPFEEIDSIQGLLEAIDKDTNTKEWKEAKKCNPWFRGQPDADKPPLPGIFREKTFQDNEHNISAKFIQKAPMLGPRTPLKEDRDEWLFLMQHVGVPTRLLDWTEGALFALYFAVCEKSDTSPAIWMIHPLSLNYRAMNEWNFPTSETNALTQRGNMAFEMFQSGELPIALAPRYIHPRMTVQKSCFTIHGKIPENFEVFSKDKYLGNYGFFRKYIINRNKVRKILEELQLLGITHSTLFPDLDGLACEIRDFYRNLKEEDFEEG